MLDLGIMGFKYTPTHIFSIFIKLLILLWGKNGFNKEARIPNKEQG